MKIRNAVFIILLFVSCRQDDDLPFQWVKFGNRITYNYVAQNNSEDNVLILSVGYKDGSEQLRLRYTYPIWDSTSTYKSAGEDYNVVRKIDGLHKRVSSNCGFGGAIFPGNSDALRAPAITFVGDTYPEYYCAKSLINRHFLIETKKEINVPLGTFSTTVLQDSVFLRKEYWDQKNGLMMIEMLDSTGIVTSRYEAASRNF